MYIHELFARSNIGDVIEYLMYGNSSDGTKELDTETRTSSWEYKKRLEESTNQFKEVMLTYDSRDEDSKLAKAFRKVSTMHQEIYFGLGIQVGFYIAKDMVSNLKYLDKMLENSQNDTSYKEMYTSLFNDVTKVIDILQNDEKESLDNIKNLLQEAQCKTEKMYIN